MWRVLEKSYVVCVREISVFREGKYETDVPELQCSADEFMTCL